MSLTLKAAHRKDTHAELAPMQHRHFATIAKIIRHLSIDGTMCAADRDCVSEHFADYLAGTNPDFDRKRFLLACSHSA